MSVMNEAIESGATPPATVRIWDPFVRVFHWLLVTLFVVAFATGDEMERTHIAVGYAIAALIVLRIVWGFVGPRHARFGDFVRSPREVIAYLRAVRLRKAPRHLGHNPAGGLMIVALITVLVATSVTGYLITTDAFWGVKWMEELHETCANVMVGFIVFHVLGALVTGFMHGENLVKAMITGRKRIA